MGEGNQVSDGKSQDINDTMQNKVLKSYMRRSDTIENKISRNVKIRNWRTFAKIEKTIFVRPLSWARSQNPQDKNFQMQNRRHMYVYQKLTEQSILLNWKWLLAKDMAVEWQPVVVLKYCEY